MAKVNIRQKQQTYLLDAVNDEAVAGDNKHFDAIHCTTAGTVQLKAGGIFQYLAAVAEGATNTNTTFINPATGVAFVAGDDDIAAGFFEGVGSAYVDVPMTAGQTIYGRITAAKIASGTFRGEAIQY
jgi:hypothetical protein